MKMHCFQPTPSLSGRKKIVQSKVCSFQREEHRPVCNAKEAPCQPESSLRTFTPLKPRLTFNCIWATLPSSVFRAMGFCSIPDFWLQFATLFNLIGSFRPQLVGQTTFARGLGEPCLSRAILERASSVSCIGTHSACRPNGHDAQS